MSFLSTLSPEIKQQCNAYFKQLAEAFEIVQGALYKNINNKLFFVSGYAFSPSNDIVFELNEGFVGQVAATKKTIVIDNLPEGYMQVFSGLGSSSPNFLVIIPYIDKNDQLQAIVEIATFKKLAPEYIKALESDYQSIEFILQK